MIESLADWNCGMDDAYACLLPRAGMQPQYYEGYYYAFALNFENPGRPVCAIAEDEPFAIPEPPHVNLRVREASLRNQLMDLKAALGVQDASGQRPLAGVPPDSFAVAALQRSTQELSGPPAR